MLGAVLGGEPRQPGGEGRPGAETTGKDSSAQFLPFHLLNILTSKVSETHLSTNVL